jgi:hypothetical protein
LEYGPALESCDKQIAKTYLFILHKLDIHDQLSRLFAHSSISQATIRQSLSLLQTDNDFAHDLELLPVDSTGLLVADESRVALLGCRNIAE